MLLPGPAQTAASTGYIGYILLQDQKTAGTDGGTATGTGSLASTAYSTRTLNTEVADTGGDCVLASNQFTLSPGTYEIEARTPGYFVDYIKSRLQNVTDGTTILAGTPEYSPSAGAPGTMWSKITGRFTIAAGKALELQFICYATKASNGLGVSANFGNIEIYSQVELRRLT